MAKETDSLHPNDLEYQPPPPSRLWRAGLAVAALLGFVGLYLLSRRNYLLFHVLIEGSSVVVSITLFSIGWNTRKIVASGGLLLLAVGSLAVGAVDLLHLLAYKGMGIFPDPGANLPTQFWIGARALEAVSLMLAALLLKNRRFVGGERLLAIYTLATIALVFSIYPLDIFPDCLVEGRGLTPFKIGSEYLICLVLAIAAWVLRRIRDHLDALTLKLLLSAILVKILAEFSFTLYGDVFGVMNFLGHAFKLVSVILLYRALVEGSLRRPYAALFRNLSRSERELRRELAERLRIEEQLKQAKSVAEQASLAKSEFLANMSHEIRTPMNAVIGMTDLALGTRLSREQRDYLEMVKDSADALLRVINDILDFSKIEAKRLELEDTPFALRTCVEQTVRALSVKAHEKKLEILCRIDPGVPQTVSGDSHRLRQVLINLIGNAIKFTECGEVKVRVEKLDGNDTDACRIRFAVKDTGIGIPREKIDQLFQKFSQVDSSTTRKFGGTGLGLAISREIVGLMGGEIEVASQPGEGSCFAFTLTLPVVEAPDAVPAPPADLHGVHVLIIDDNQTNRSILQEILGTWGMEISSAGSGEEGLDILRRARTLENPVRLLLLDSQMPGMDGFAVAEKIRREPSLGEPAVMMVTSEDIPGAAARCRKLGIHRYLVKPVRQSELFEAVVETLAGTLPEGDSARANQPSPVARQPVPKAVVRRPLRILLAEDNVINLKLALILLDRQGWEVTVAVDGQAALELWRRETFDLILMDVQMPELDGIEATRRIRQEEGAGRRIPIVGLSAHALPEDRKACLEAGMDDYVTKPLSPDRLFDAIERACSLPEKGGCEDQGPAINLSDLRHTVKQDQTFISEISRDFLSSYPPQLELLQQGLRTNDCSTIERTAHSLKAVAGIFGAMKASKLAAELEHMAEKSDLSDATQALAALEQEMDRVRSALEEAIPDVV